MATIPVNANTKPAVSEIDRLIDALIKTGKQAGLSEQAIEKMVNEARTGGREATKGIGGLNSELGKTNNILKTVGGGLVALFAVDQIKKFVGEVVRVTAEFQRFEAVLTNTLGSRSAARAALQDIQNFAKTTPFQVAEITAAYVRWANQGLNPTIEKMRKLGDIGSSLGAGFEQTAEAFKDLLVGQTKRLEEIGISATQNNGKIQLSFKGVNLEIEKNVQGVEKALDVYSQLDGVLGTSDAVINTLGGKISNLGDAWKLFLTTVGDGNNGYLMQTVNLLTQAVDKARERLTTDSQERQREGIAIYTEQADKLKQLYEQEGDVQKARTIALQQLHARLQDVNRQLEESSAIVRKLEKEDANRWFAAFSVMDELEDEYARNNKLVNEYNDLLNEGQKAIIETAKEIEKSNKVVQKKVELTKDEKRLLKELSDWKNESISRDVEYWQRLKDEADEYLQSLYKIKDTEFVPEPDAPEERDDTSYRQAKAAVAAREKEKEAIDALKQYSIMAFDEMFNARAYNVQRELSMLQQAYNHEIILAGNNDKAKEKIRLEFARKEAALQAKQARIQQEQALFNIAVNQGPAIVKTISNVGLPWAIPLVAAIGLIVGSQLNQTRGVKQPRFAAEGDYDISGPGTETSDSIPYMLSVHETVTPARATRKFGKLLKPMVEDKDLNWHDIKNIVDSQLNTSLPPMIIARAGADTNELRDELRGVRKAIENKTETRFQFDENGFGYWVGKKGDWTKYVRGRYGV